MAFVIKEHRPGRWRLAVLIVIMLWLVSAWLAYRHGLNESNYDSLQADTRQAALEKEVQKQLTVNEALRSQVSILKRTAQVDREAKTELARDLKELQDLQTELREEISFYKSILTPAKGKDGLDIYSLDVAALDEHVYHFKIVLTQSGKSDSVTEGEVKMHLKGVLKGKEKQLAFEDIRVAGSPKLSYKFRYFEELSGSFSLPEGYVPREVVVSLKPQADKRGNIPLKTFDWLNVRLNRDDFDGR